MNESLWLPVLLALIVSVVAPVITAFITSRNRRIERKEEWERQDRLAAATNTMLERQDGLSESIRLNHALLAHTDERAAEDAIQLGEKLDGIHALVNGKMTAAMEAELDATVREIALMREIVDLKRGNGVEPTEEILRAIVLSEKRISELRVTLRDRARQMRAYEEQERRRVMRRIASPGT